VSAPVQTRYAVGFDTAPALAAASTRYRLTRPAFWVPLAVEAALAAAFAAAGHPVWGVALLAVVLLQPLGLLLQTRSLAGSMARRGYRPGTVLTVDWHDETFTVATPDAVGTHRYQSVIGPRVVGGAVVLRVRGARVLLLLPAEAVPDSVRPRLGLSA